MARVVGRSRPPVEGNTGLKFSETIVFGVVAVLLVVGLRYYFVTYRGSAGYAVSEYLGGVKAGNVQRQYTMLDENDVARLYPTQEEYAKNAKQARGYTERLTSWSMEKEIPDAKKTDTVTVLAHINMRGGAKGKELYQTGDTITYNDTYTLHKDKEGKWKIVLSKSKSEMLEKAEPNPPGDSF